VDGQRHAPAALPPGKSRYPLYRRLGGPQGRSGRVQKTSQKELLHSMLRAACGGSGSVHGTTVWKVDRKGVYFILYAYWLMYGVPDDDYEISKPVMQCFNYIITNWHSIWLVIIRYFKVLTAFDCNLPGPVIYRVTHGNLTSLKETVLSCFSSKFTFIQN
jgi:hypothetical protein